jgi:hypothetical protein
MLILRISAPIVHKVLRFRGSVTRRKLPFFDPKREELGAKGEELGAKGEELGEKREL